MHNGSVRPSGQWLGVWVPCARDLRKLDDVGTRSINGDDGGLWTPANPIIIGGAGLALISTATSIQGGVTTARGGRMALSPSDSVAFSPARTHSVVVPLRTIRRRPAAVPPLAYNADPAGLIDVYVDPTNPSADLPFADHDVPLGGLYVHKGSTLTSAVLSFRVGQKHAALPANYPAFLLTLLPPDRSSTPALYSGASGLAVLPTPANTDAYFALGAPQTITMTCDQNNTNLPSETNALMLSIHDEYGANSLAGNIFHSLTLNFTAIADMGFE